MTVVSVVAAVVCFALASYLHVAQPADIEQDYYEDDFGNSMQRKASSTFDGIKVSTLLIPGQLQELNMNIMDETKEKSPLASKFSSDVSS